MKAPVAVTIASKAYLALARVTARGFCEHHPGIPFVLVLTDEVEGFFDPAQEPYELVTIRELGVAQLERFRFQYSQQEFSYAVTPHVIEYLLDRGHDGVLFLKQETLVLDTLTPLFEALRTHPLMLTPHFLVPPARGDVVRRELDVLRAGVYNGGVLFVANHPSARAFLAWWKARTFRYCLCRVEEGLHYEQRWLDFAPALVPGSKVIRDPGVNVGHWNLAERDIRVSGGRVSANGQPCRVFRFSGYDPAHPDRITKYYPERLTTENGAWAWVFNHYHQRLMAEGHAETSLWPYAYGRYDDGTVVTEGHRRRYRKLGDRVLAFGDPLLSGSDTSFLKWLKWRGLRPLPA